MSDTNKTQNMARGLKFQILEEEGLYYLCSENKVPDQLWLTYTFVFAYAKSRFFHDAAHSAIFLNIQKSLKLVVQSRRFYNL